MQIGRDQQRCPACAAAGLAFAPLFHHMICAYVGPEYDFTPTTGGYRCPKCERFIALGDKTCEIVGTSARCVQCRREILVSPSDEAITRA
jgi:hypothetical protein